MVFEWWKYIIFFEWWKYSIFSISFHDSFPYFHICWYDSRTIPYRSSLLPQGRRARQTPVLPQVVEEVHIRWCYPLILLPCLWFHKEEFPLRIYETFLTFIHSSLLPPLSFCCVAATALFHWLYTTYINFCFEVG